MEIYRIWALVWMVTVSLVAVCMTAWDKTRARRREWRVAESTLWLGALLGGAAAMYLTMLFVRHKTRHRRFMIGLPLLILAQMGFIYYIVHKQYLIFV